jgi:hypothetical protein
MSQQPLNLLLRFLLELAALAAIGFWGWAGHEGPLRYALAIGLPLIAAGLWAVFRVEGDESSGATPIVAVSGILRLILEVVLFAFATWCLFAAGATAAGWVFAGLILLHYALSYDRISWLLAH